MDLLPPYVWIEEMLGIDPDVQTRIFRSVVVILILWIAHRLVLGLVLGRIQDFGLRYRVGKSIGYVTVLIGAFLVGRIWLTGIQPLATYLGLLSAGLAIALQDLVASLAAWVFIIWRRPFDVGDRIQIGEHAGDVIDTRVFQFTLLEIQNWIDADQPTGRLVHVPNNKIFKEPLANYSRGTRYIWNELPVLVTFESNWESAKRIMQEIANTHTENAGETARQDLLRASSRFRLHQIDLEPRVFTSVEDSGVLLTLRYLCEPRRRRGTAEVIWEDILRAFAQRTDIDFAYPTIRYYHNPTEGKPDAKAEPFPTGQTRMD